MSNEKGTEQLEDKELDDLLDSALEDFKKYESEPEAERKEESKKEESEETAESLDEVWTTDFLRQAADEMEKTLQHLLSNGGASTFEKSSEREGGAMPEGEVPDGDTANADFSSAVARALSELSAANETFSNDAELSEMLAETTLEDGASTILPFMQGMLQNLFSKEMLYPSLKELVSDKYPKWFAEKRDTLSESEVEKYNKRMDLLRKICEELETEKEDDSEELKKQRFNSILSLMQELQSCGQLPDDLGGDESSRFQFDPEAILGSMESPQNCCLM